MDLLFKTFQGITVDKDGNITKMGMISINANQVIGVIECIDKFECVISNCCSLLIIGGGQITIQGKLADVVEKLQEDKGY